MPVKIKASENITKESVNSVLEFLDSGGTKKEACAMLRIAYNTSRLAKILEEFKESEKLTKSIKAKLRKTPLTESDISYIMTEYLKGRTYTDIAEEVFRSLLKIKKVLIDNNIPIRNNAFNYTNPIYLEDDSIKKDYEKDDLVFSAKYNVPAIINSLITKDKNHGNVYSIWLLGIQQNACQPYYELGDLTHIQDRIGKL